EGGGQLSDNGVIRNDGPSGPAEIAVTDVQTPLPGLVVHRGTVRSGEVVVGSPAHAEIEVERRRATSRSHTATHLVHRALRHALGESAAQAGSENAPGRLRFDFTASGAVPTAVLRVEALVGIDAFRFLARESVLVSQLSEQLKARPDELPERISGVVTRLRDAERELARLRSAELLSSSGEIAHGAENIDGTALV